MDLITESAEVGNSNISISSGGSLDENPIRQVINQVHNATVETGAEKSKGTESTGNDGPNDVKKDVSSQQAKANSGSIPEKIVWLAYNVLYLD